MMSEVGTCVRVEHKGRQPNRKQSKDRKREKLLKPLRQRAAG